MVMEERDGLDSSSLDVVKSLLMDDAIAGQTKEEGMDECPVKVRKPYTITKQREKWTEQEHHKFLEALKLYGRSWRQIQEHIGTKTAIQIRSHAQKFFSKVVRQPVAKIAIEIPPPRPKRKPLHPYPRKSASSCNGAYPAAGQPKLAPISSSSGSNQENGSPVSVLSVMQSDAFGSSMSNQSTRCTSPSSSDDGNNNVPPLVSGEGNNTPCQQTGTDQSHKEIIDQDTKDTDMSEQDSSDEVQETSLKLFGKTIAIPDPRTRCSSDTGDKNSQSSNQQTSQAPLVGDVAACTAPNGWLLPCTSFPLDFGETPDARMAPLHMWWPYYGFPVGHSRGLTTAAQNEAVDESDGRKSPRVDSAHKWKAMIQGPQSASNFELKPSRNSAFGRVKPSGSGDGSIRGFVPYTRCKV